MIILYIHVRMSELVILRSCGIQPFDSASTLDWALGQGRYTSYWVFEGGEPRGANDAESYRGQEEDSSRTRQKDNRSDNFTPELSQLNQDFYPRQKDNRPRGDDGSQDRRSSQPNLPRTIDEVNDAIIGVPYRERSKTKRSAPRKNDQW
jgi:hypothetical protein